MPAYRYEFYLLVVNSISHSFAALTREISSWPLEDKIHIHARACNILYLSACKSLVIHLRFHQNENLLKFSRRRRLDDVLTKSHMRRTLARENFTSARRRRAISLPMLKVPIVT